MLRLGGGVPPIFTTTEPLAGVDLLKKRGLKSEALTLALVVVVGIVIVIFVSCMVVCFGNAPLCWF